MKLIDSHCHLGYDYAPKSTEDLIREAALADVSVMMNIGVDLGSIAGCEALSARFPNVFHTVGVHPHEAKELLPADIERLRAAAKHPKCRAIGEIGLDYYYDHSPREVQRARFDEQLKLALECELPVVIHCRDAEPDALESLTRYAKALPSGRIPGILHCFTGTVGFGEACLKLGFYVSFSGLITFKNAEGIREAARAYPLERLLVETDAPYLAPIPFRGKKCEPSMVRYTAQKLAEVKGVAFEEVVRATTQNALDIFKLPRDLV